MQIEKYYNDLNTLHINTEENRAYYMPCSDIENASVIHKVPLTV